MRKLLIGSLVFGILWIFFYHASVFRVAKNFHEVDPGRFYRSAQLTDDELKEVVSKYHIKTVINLRGFQPEEEWYQKEENLLDDLGVELVNVGFNTQSVPKREELLVYLKALSVVKRPILVHCRAGADRSGEASAIYEIEYMKYSREKALDQLSLKYLHTSIFQPAKKYFIAHYQGVDWAKDSYTDCNNEFKDYADWNAICNRDVEGHHTMTRRLGLSANHFLGSSWHIPFFEKFKENHPSILGLKRAYGYMNF